MMDNQHLTDKVLLLQIGQGDEHSFNQLFERYRNRLFTYLFKITKSKETAEEIVLDVFLKIWHGREMAIQIENPEAFLFRVAQNKALDFLRAVKRNPLKKREIWDAMQEFATSESADAGLLSKNIEAAIGQAVHLLSPQRQKVFQLRHTQGMRYDEIAEQLDLSRNTVRNHLAASLQFIKDFLGKGYGLFFSILLGLLKIIF